MRTPLMLLHFLLSQAFSHLLSSSILASALRGGNYYLHFASAETESQVKLNVRDSQLQSSGAEIHTGQGQVLWAPTTLGTHTALSYFLGAVIAMLE